MSPIWLKLIYSFLCKLTWRPMPAAPRSRLWSGVSACGCVFASSTISSAYRRLNAMPDQARGVRILWLLGHDRIVQWGNYCCSSISVASVDENKNSNRKITKTKWKINFVKKNKTCLQSLILPVYFTNGWRASVFQQLFHLGMQ